MIGPSTTGQQPIPGEGRSPVPGEEELLLSLSQDSSLLVVLRALYSLMLDYGVTLTDRGDAIVFSKEQMVTLVERGEADSPMKDMPRLVEDGLLRPLSFDGTYEAEVLEELGALVVERRGARVTSLAKAVNPAELEYPVWWEAPIPFALCGRGHLKLNRTALLMFGPDLERLNAAALPEKDEFIVELEGRGHPCFLAFSRLEPNIFTIDDCTGDLVEAQDISWWAAVGRAWTAELEAGGQTWRRVDAIPEGFEGRSWPCEWQGRFLGYLIVEPAALSMSTGEGAVPLPEPRDVSEEEPRPPKPKKRARRASSKAGEQPKEDEVLKALGPQTMALLAAGQARDEEVEPEEPPKPVKRSRGRAKK